MGHLDVYVPRAVQAGAMPLIVFLYGGSWNSGSKESYGFAGRALAAQDFAVVLPDYRLVPAVRFPVFLEDNAGVVRWARANAWRFGGDSDRIVTTLAKPFRGRAPALHDVAAFAHRATAPLPRVRR